MNRRPPLPFEHLLAALRAAGLLEVASGDPGTPIARLAHDSRSVEPHTCFFAIEGGTVDGHLFLDKAVQQGATAAVCERPPAEAIDGLRALARVSDSRAALAEAAAVFFGRPSEALQLVGVTGTNGKTTVTHFIHHALMALGAKSGLVGTIDVRVGDRPLAATHTTPDALALNELLAEMVEAGCSACAMEVSSHALDQDRVRAQRFAVGVFTNLTHDHIDYHGSFDAYAAAKAILFENLPSDATAVVNRDDPAWGRMVTECQARIVTYGREETQSPAVDEEIVYRIEANEVTGLRLRIDGVSRWFPIPGVFNASNYVAAYGALRALGYEQRPALDALAEAPAVPGRMEIVVSGGGPTVIVDYAHTPDALDNILRTTAEMVPEGGRLAVVFGCGGDRDRAKRPVMGRIASELAHLVVLTNDNPRSEDPQEILEQIEDGMPSPPYAIIPDRAEAIRRTIAESGERDVVVVAGKGHETYQIVGATRLHFDDREVARAALVGRGAPSSDHSTTG